MLVLSQFVLRLSFGLALAMAITSPKQVTSGYFRIHSYVLLGLNVLATLAALSSQGELSWWEPLAGAILSYACATGWLYEKPKAGRRILSLIFALSLANAVTSQTVPVAGSNAAGLVINSSLPAGVIGLWFFNAFTSGLLLGATIAAMFLGHWYLNTPTMQLEPLRRLLKLMAVAILMRAVVCGVGLILQFDQAGFSSTQWLLVALRWIAGMVGADMLTAMAWQTLKIPNTQSATGILYVAVIATFLGELTSLLLSASTAYPL